MYWVLQNNLYAEKEYDTMVETLDRMGLPYSVHKIRPFTAQMIPEATPPPGSVIVMGSTSLVRIAKKRGWTPGAFQNANFDFEVQRSHWGERMLNHDAVVCPFRDVPKQAAAFPGDDIFIRPQHDTKSFTGLVMSWDKFQAWHYRIALEMEQDSGCTVKPSTMVVVSSPKNLYWEYRLWVVDRKVVTSSAYCNAGRLWVTPVVNPEALKFAEEAVALWAPDRAFVIDIAETAEGLKIIEVNNLNSAGFYACNVGKLVEALEGMGW